MKKFLLLVSAVLLVAAGSVWPADNTGNNCPMGFYYYGVWTDLPQLTGGNDTPAIPPGAMQRNPHDTGGDQVPDHLVPVLSGDPDLPIGPRHLRDGSGSGDSVQSGKLPLR